MHKVETLNSIENHSTYNFVFLYVFFLSFFFVCLFAVLLGTFLFTLFSTLVLSERNREERGRDRKKFLNRHCSHHHKVNYQYSVYNNEFSDKLNCTQVFISFKVCVSLKAFSFPRSVHHHRRRLLPHISNVVVVFFAFVLSIVLFSQSLFKIYQKIF